MSERDKKLLIFLAGFLFIAASYFLVFQKGMEQRQALELENASLQARVDELLGYAQKEEFYREQISTMGSEINSIVSRYPVYLQDENEIMDVVALEKETDTFVSTLTITPAVAVPVVVANSEESAEATASENTSQATTEGADTAAKSYQLYDYGINMNLTTGYDGFKKLVDEIVGKDVRSIQSVMITYDNTNGLLSGTVMYDAYFLSGQDKPYQAPELPSIKHGTKNIFGSLSSPITKTSQEED